MGVQGGGKQRWYLNGVAYFRQCGRLFAWCKFADACYRRMLAVVMVWGAQVGL